jgi:hypothetical protein
MTSPPFPPASPPTPHDTPAAYTQFTGLTACQGLGALEYNFLAVFAAAEHTFWRRGASAQVRLCRSLPINYKPSYQLSQSLVHRERVKGCKETDRTVQSGIG